jgi:hypothetical protein
MPDMLEVRRESVAIPTTQSEHPVYEFSVHQASSDSFEVNEEEQPVRTLNYLNYDKVEPV